MPPKKKAATKTAAPRHRMGWDRKDAKGKALEDFKAKFASDMGSSLQTLKADPSKIEAIPTGSLDLDVALGIGGWRVGRIHEVWGVEHAGKTTLAILSCIEALRVRPNQMVGWIDMEQTFDEVWAEALGLDLSKVLFHTPINAEDTADAAKRMIMSGMCSMVVLDSVGSMISRAEFEKEADEAVMAKVAKIVTRMVQQASPIAKANETTILVINQVRARIASFGADTHTAGGWALKHVTSSRVALSSGADQPRKVRINGEDIPVSKQVAGRVEKNKSAAMGYRAKFWITNVETEKHGPIGVDRYAEALSVGKKTGVIKGASWMTLPCGERLQGGEKVMEFLKEHPESMQTLRDAVLASVRNRVEAEPEDTDDELEEFINSEEGAQ